MTVTNILNWLVYITGLGSRGVLYSEGNYHSRSFHELASGPDGVIGMGTFS